MNDRFCILHLSFSPVLSHFSSAVSSLLSLFTETKYVQNKYCEQTNRMKKKKKQALNNCIGRSTVFSPDPFDRTCLSI